MDGLTFPTFLTLFTTILGLTGLIVGVYFFVRNTATKSNFEGLKETISTLKGNRDEWKNQAQESEKENQRLRDSNAQMIGENKTLRELATQTPEIVALTKAVTSLTGTVEQGQKEIIELFRREQKDRKAN